MDKQKQSEEMYQEFLYYKGTTPCEVFSYRGMCENFINLGYTKIDYKNIDNIDLMIFDGKRFVQIPEGAVVLTREDWESEAYVRAMENELCKECRKRIGEEYEKLLEKIRILEVQLDLERPLSIEQMLKIKGKHTANKIMNDISGDVLVVDTKEYGRIEVVPLERLDEICEEFTGETK